MRKEFINTLLPIALTFALTANILLASTTFETKRHNYYGRESAIEKLVVTVVPVHKDDPNDHNDVNSTATSDEEVFGEIKRVTIAAIGTDVNFSVIIKDGMGISLLNKTDCNTVLLPLSYNLNRESYPSSTYSVPFGLLVAGPLIIDTNYVDPCNLSSITVAIYYLNPSK
jgi:hypothetical protein